MDSYKEELQKVQEEIDLIEQNNKSSSVIIYNLPGLEVNNQTSNQTQTECVLNLAKRQLGVQIGKSDVADVKLLGKPNGDHIPSVKVTFKNGHLDLSAHLKKPTQPIRLLLAYTGTDFEDKYYVCGEGPSYDKSCWFDTKHSLGLDFPNLPYYIDGDVKITQSNAILRFIARKYDPSLLGSNSEEMVRVDMLENEAGDFRNGFVRLCYRNFNENKDNYKNALPLKLKEFSNFLGNRKFFAGDHVTFPDFIMYEMLDQHKIFSPSCLEEFPNLKDFAPNASFQQIM
ncbi:hypothetical protein QYM36_002997 [Artemia franciscana]|uniref:glutathione transferase n=1 Tax=Artemia franciscana TaxID=6661 RepID=A0AA88I4I8_ARTSF|nr:hypothetical protein QYM36_002997 [Artemia franciscana]